jgi:putative transferase (TIGR04331 family)
MGMLESLASNSPMIAFWSGGLSHLKDHVKPQYEWLIDAGIVHLSGESAARKISEIWDNVNAWWQSESVQSARVRFCEIYARTSRTPAADLLKIIKDDL